MGTRLNVGFDWLGGAVPVSKNPEPFQSCIDAADKLNGLIGGVSLNVTVVDRGNTSSIQLCILVQFAWRGKVFAEVTYPMKPSEIQILQFSTIVGGRKAIVQPITPDLVFPGLRVACRDLANEMKQEMYKVMGQLCVDE